MEKIEIVRLTGDALDALRTGGTVLLVHQNTIYGIGKPLDESLKFERPATIDGIVKAWKLMGVVAGV